MTSFARTPEGRAAAERMMRTHGHTNAFMPPRPGFPGDPEQKARMLEVQKNLQQNLGAGLGQPVNNPPPQQPLGRGGIFGGRANPARSPQIAQMEGILQGNPVGVMPRSNPEQGIPTPANPMPMPQQPVGRGGRGTTPATQVTPPSFASQMGRMGISGLGLQSMFGNKPTGMKKGGAVKKKAGSKTYKSGGSVSSASKRADGCAIKGKTRGKIV